MDQPLGFPPSPSWPSMQSPDGSDQSGEEPLSLQTLKISAREREASLQRLLGNSYFREGMSLVLSIGQAEPLIIQPQSTIVIGRTEINTLDAHYINLTPYDARAKGVSHSHARLHFTKRTIAIEDQDSSNGTFVNGYRLKPFEAHVLHDGDELSLGLLVIQITFR